MQTKWYCETWATNKGRSLCFTKMYNLAGISLCRIKRQKMIIENKSCCLATVYAASITGNRNALLVNIVKILIQLQICILLNLFQFGYLIRRNWQNVRIHVFTYLGVYTITLIINSTFCRCLHLQSLSKGTCCWVYSERPNHSSYLPGCLRYSPANSCLPGNTVTYTNIPRKCFSFGLFSLQQTDLRVPIFL